MTLYNYIVMKNFVLLVFLSTALSQAGYSQNVLDGVYLRDNQSYPCETSPIGKLVTKPLVKNNRVHYEDAIFNKQDQRNYAVDGVGISQDSLHNTYIMRFHELKDSTLNLLFVYNNLDESCSYQLSVLYTNKKGMNSFRISSEGKILDRDEKDHMTAAQRADAQKQADKLLKYYK
jgi:hypothetical protein